MLVPTLERFFLFHRKIKLHFLHIPKCGGSTIDTTFSPWIKHCETRTLSGSKGHLTYLEYSKLFTTLGRPQPIRWFTVIRNPWDWHVSWFHYIKGDANGRHSGMQLDASLFQNFSFADYVNCLKTLPHHAALSAACTKNYAIIW
jgi:hypothetical protein